MSDATADAAAPRPEHERSIKVAGPNVRRRHRAETRFKVYGIAAVTVGVLALVLLLISILSNGLSSFRQTFVSVPITLDPEIVDPQGNRNPAEMSQVFTFGYEPLIENAVVAAVQRANLEVPEGLSGSDIAGLISGQAAGQLRQQVLDDPDLVGETIEARVLAAGRIDGFFKGRVTLASAERDIQIMPEQLILAERMREAGLIEVAFNWDFITAPDASGRRPEAAGLGVAILGSFYMMLVVLALVLPIGVGASIYLEEFAPKNRFTDLIEVNISNLAAVPSIVFGILGLAIFINGIDVSIFGQRITVGGGLPQSAPIVGGLVLTLMTLPTIIIATRAALRAVPPSIRSAALGLGASKMQSVFHHVLPLAAPGILTGTIIGIAQALGETAPLLLIGMVAFVRDYPSAPPEGFFDPATALPVQVYSWTQRSDPAFVERASGAIIVLLIFLLFMNALAIVLRRRFERRW